METFDVVAPPTRERRKLSARCKLAEIEEEFGIGAYLYFDFLRFLILLDLVIFLILCGNWVPHVVDHPTLAYGLDLFFVSGYEASNRLLWRATTGAAFALAAAGGWLYPLRARHVRRKRDATADFTGDQLWALDSMNILPEQMGFIERNLRLTPCARGGRLALSLSLFAVFTAVCAAAIATPVVFQVQLVELVSFDLGRRIWYTPITVWDFLVAALLSVLDFLGKRVAGTLTHIERHKRRATHSKHKTAKLFIFKIVLVSSLYIAQRIASNILNQSVECPMRPEAIRFLTILISDVTIGTFLTWLVPALRKVKERKAIRKGDPFKPIQFDIGNEHMELLYRQFVMCLGMSVFPLVALFVALINLLEFPLDRARLVWLCQDTKKITGSLAVFLACVLSLMAALGLVVWPDGGLYSLTGPTLQASNYCPCRIFFDLPVCAAFAQNITSSSSFA